jgi:AraC family transcriptional regulator
MLAAATYRPATPRGGLSRRALQRACEFMRDRIGERFSLQDVASSAAVSRFHFARMFRVSTGLSPMSYLLQLRIDAARRWLQAGDRRIADIAAALGFCDQSHFTRTFRRATGLAPSEFARCENGRAARVGNDRWPAARWSAANDDRRPGVA